jgi:hypothetical protein
MLILTRRISESINIGDDISVRILQFISRMFVFSSNWEIKMDTFNHSYYESDNFCDDGSVIIDTHGFRLKIKIHTPEQKIVHWVNLFGRNKAGHSQLENKKNP